MTEKNNTFHIDLTGLKMGDFAKVSAINIADPQSLAEGLPILTQRVKAWPYASDPARVESYYDLDLFEEWMPLIRSFATELERRVKQLGE